MRAIYIRRWLCRHFQLVYREDHEALLHRWIQHSERLRVDIGKLERDLHDALVGHSTALRDLDRERESSRRLLLQWLILDVGPAETMEHTLWKAEALHSYLKRCKEAAASDGVDGEHVLKAVGEIEQELAHGLELWRKNKKPEVTKNVGSAA